MFFLKSKKHILFNSIRDFFCGTALVLLASCSSSGSGDWPKMEADNLWQELEQINASSSPLEGQNVMRSDGASLLPPDDGIAEIPDIDMIVSMDEVERDLPFYKENMAKALDRYGNAADDDRALHWRGVEIEISRLNDVTGKLRAIDHQLTEQAGKHNLLNRARILLKQVEGIIPERPKNLNL